MIYENPILSGSVLISGSLQIEGKRLLSSSQQIASEISGSSTLISLRVTELENFSSSLASSLTTGLDYLPNLAVTQSSIAGKIINGTTYPYMYSALGFHWGSTGYVGSEVDTTSIIVDGVALEYLNSEVVSGASLPSQNRLIPVAQLNSAFIAKIQSIGTLDSSFYYLRENQVALYHSGSIPRKYFENSSTVIALANTSSFAYTSSIANSATTATSASYANLASTVHNTNIVSSSIQFWQGAQAEYDALPATDNNTVYFITG